MLTVLLVRHAKSIPPGPGFEDERTRPLSAAGLVQAEVLVPTLRAENPVAFYSSPYLRSIQTVAPAAAEAGMSVQILEDFREHRMAPTSVTNWREILFDQWADFDYAYPGGESLSDTKSRGLSVLDHLAGLHSDGTIVLAGHGTINSLVLHHATTGIDFDYHLAMPNPALHRLQFDGATWHHRP